LADAIKLTPNQRPSTQHFNDAFTYIQRGFKPIGNRHTSHDWSWTKHSKSFGHSSRWQTNIKCSNNESTKHATLEHVVDQMFDALHQRLLLSKEK